MVQSAVVGAALDAFHTFSPETLAARRLTGLVALKFSGLSDSLDHGGAAEWPPNRPHGGGDLHTARGLFWVSGEWVVSLTSG